MTRLLVGPFNRVEGDLEVQLDIEDGQVRSAKVNATMFRGFEQILRDHEPLDALVYAPRVCGICSVSQSVAAARALGALAGVQRLVVSPGLRPSRRARRKSRPQVGVVPQPVGGAQR